MPPAFPRLFGAIGAIGAVAVTTACMAQQAPSWSAADQTRFDDWKRLASAESLSPASAGPGDLTVSWTTPDGRPADVVVRAPAPTPGAPVVTTPPVAAGADARPVFDAALDQARRTGARMLEVPRGTYVFRTPEPNGRGQLFLQGLADLVIDGQGSTFAFDNPGDGLWIANVTRVKITHLTLDYDVPTSALGTIQTDNGVKVLKLQGPPPPSTTQIVQVSGYDPSAMTWSPNGPRLMFGDNNPNGPKAVAPGVYASSQFAGVADGASVVVKFHFYKGAAIQIADSGPARPTTDLTIEDVHIQASTGTGITAYRMGRGLAILDSTIGPAPKGANPLSADFDALHITSTQGDVLIRGNEIRGQGDDAVNLLSPVTTVTAVEPGGASIRLSKNSGFIAAGDRLALFDAAGEFLASAAAQDRASSGRAEVTVSLNAPLPSDAAPRYLRDLTRSGSRFAVLNNRISHCECHGLLVQIPNGLVQGNTFSDLRFNAIRLLTSLDPWMEGVGAFDVMVRDNHISNTGPDSALHIPWGAITAYGQLGNEVTSAPVNADLAIENNSVANVAQGCITITSSQAVQLAGNQCAGLHRDGRGGDAIVVDNVRGVRVKGNSVEGASSAIRVSHSSAP